MKSTWSCCSWRPTPAYFPQRIACVSRISFVPMTRSAKETSSECVARSLSASPTKGSSRQPPTSGYRSGAARYSSSVRKVAANVRLNRRQLRVGQQIRDDDVAVLAPVPEMSVGDPHALRKHSRRDAGAPPSVAVLRSPIAEVRHRRGAAQAHREAHLHARIVVVQLARPARILEQQAIRILEVDRLHPLVVDDGGHAHALRDQLGTLRLERLERADLEGEVIEHVGQAEAAVDAGVVLARDAGHAARLHEGKQLPVAGIEEDVADLAALLHLHRIAAHRLEAEDALVEGARAVHVEGGEADVGKTFACHDQASVQSIAMPPPMLTDCVSPSDHARHTRAAVHADRLAAEEARRDQPFFAAAAACWSAGVGGMPGTERCSRKAASKLFAISAAVKPPSL